MVFFEGRRVLVVAGLVLAVAGCSSSGGGGKPVDTPTPSTAAASSPATASPTATGVAGRPADPCSVLTNAQVSAAMGGASPLLAEGPSKERPWSCTWGSRRSYVSLRSVDNPSFTEITGDSRFKSQPLSGIGDSAVLLTRAADGSRPELLFTVGAAHYAIEAVADRSETGSANTPAESAAEQALAGLAAAKLHG